MITKLIAGALAWAALLTLAPLVWPQPGVAKGGPGPSGNVRDDGADAKLAEWQKLKDAIGANKNDGKFLLIWVNAEPLKFSGAISIEVGEFQWEDKPALIVYSGGQRCGINGVWSFEPRVFNANFVMETMKRQVSQSAGPFTRSGQQPSAEPDDSRRPAVAGPKWYNDAEQAWIKSKWPKSLPFPDGVDFYRSTRWVQRSAVTDDRLSVATLPRPDDEWMIPGGLRGIAKNQWQSYRGVKRGMMYYTNDRIDRFAEAAGGKLRRVTRWFEDGTSFFDLLLGPTGEAFEVRSTEYMSDADYEWLDFSVMYRDADAAPINYVRPKRVDCVTCHMRAGEVAYASGNVPGGGGVFSFPLLTED